jgi:hypothetical protein
MRFERVRRPLSLPLLLTRGDTIEITHACTRAQPPSHARDTHTQFTMTLLGRRAGTACWLTGVVASNHSWMHAADPPTVASPPSNG